MKNGGIVVSKIYETENYKDKLDIRTTDKAIKFVKDNFENTFARHLNLERITAPLFVTAESGLNDDLSGRERPVAFDIPDAGEYVQVVHSLAKWKRKALLRYGFEAGEGIYTDMNAIRRDEELDNIHSVYVDQWDWEKVIEKEDRNLDYLCKITDEVFSSLCETQEKVCMNFPKLTPLIKRNFKMITTEELLKKYPDMTAKERENAICREYGSVLLTKIGDKLSNGEPHDMRAPDYDDWQLNGDILIWYEPLGRALELSSMGIRVDPESMLSQLRKANCMSRSELPFHKELIEGKLPLTVGGGIGQSRICMVMLNKVHIGEVQASIWSNDIINDCKNKGITLL